MLQGVLIDEPEISLHVDWQRRLLRRMAEQIGGRQIIVCTHSPTIGADYEERQTELVLKPTRKPFAAGEFDWEPDIYESAYSDDELPF